MEGIKRRKHIYKIIIYRYMKFKKVFKISSYDDIDEINKNIREQSNGNLISFYDLKDRFIHFDRDTIYKIIVKEV